MSNQAAIKVTKKKLLDILSHLNRPIVLTKNKDEASEKNFRPDSKNPEIMLDGYWAGKPLKIEKGDFCAHYITHKREIWIGTYDGALPLKKRESSGKQRYSLVMKEPKVYKIADYDKPSDNIDPILMENFLHKNGSVTYTYFQTSTKNTIIKKPSPQSSVDEEFTGAEKMRLLSTRVNHGKLRTRTLKEFNYSCCITGIDISELLVCSHIKPWSKSRGDEKTDRYNVLLLASNWDSVFDKGFITIQDNGEITFSKRLTDSAKKSLGISGNVKFDPKYLTSERKKYLDYHRGNIFIKG